MRRVAQLSFDDARRKAPIGPPLTVLPDAARVEEHLVRRATPFVAGQVACTLLQLERELVRNARADGACPKVASPEALALLFRDVCREETPREGPFWGIRDQPGFARTAQDLMSALAQGLIEPAELLRLTLPETTRERIAPLATLLLHAQKALDRRGLADPNRALRLAVDALAGGGALPPMARNGVAEELASALERVGIPWRERRGRPALPAPPVQLALRILGLVERRFPREELEQVLSSRLLWLPDHGHPMPPQAALRRLREAHVRDDALGGGYAARLRALAARLKARARSRANEATDPVAAASALDDAARAATDVAEVAERVESILA